MSRQEMTKHEKAITLWSKPDGNLGYLYWVTCDQHGNVGSEVRTIEERTHLVKFHLRGLL